MLPLVGVRLAILAVLAGIVGHPPDVPVLLGLVYVALWARHRFYPAASAR